MKVFHVQGKNLKEIHPPFEFLNGDVYLIDNSDVSPGLTKKVFIWLGSQAFADDRAVGAWAAKQLDLKDKEIDIDTEVESNESEEFKKLVSFSVVTGDTPGFLRHVEVNKEDISYALYRVRDVDLSDGSSSDDIVIENVPLRKDSFKSEDVFVLDAYHDLYIWVGANSQVGEKAAGNRLVRKLDVDRDRNPMVYNINESYEPSGFFELINKLSESGTVRTDDAQAMGKGITGAIADLTSLGPPPEIKETITPRPKFEVTDAPPVRTSEPAPTPAYVPAPEPRPKDLGLTASTAKPVQGPKSVYKLYYVNGQFSEKGGNEDAVLEINDATQKATLMFKEGTGLITQRTASRQARGICKAGFQTSSGFRIGLNCTLTEVKGEKGIDDRLLQEGHKYK